MALLGKKPIRYWLVAGVVALAVALFAFFWVRRPLQTVQTSRVEKSDLTSVVTASGEIKPKNYVHISANTFGRLVEIPVKEGDFVRMGQVLARLEAVQADADVQAQQAQLAAAQTDVGSAEAVVQTMQASVRTAQAVLARAKAQLERADQDFRRAQSLYEEQLISRSAFEQAQAEYNTAVATVEEAEARTAQAQAQLRQAQSQAQVAHERVRQVRASLDRLRDVLSKHTFVAPLDGVVIDLPVSVGENVVMGVQNAPGSLLMTIADLSVITAEVLVDETDIATIRVGQPAQVRVDAFPERLGSGSVTEIGNTALVRSTGLAAGQSTTSSQQAKDFKVVITLDNPDSELRPGLSATGEIITATRKSTLAVPLQSLTVRQREDLERQSQDGSPAPALAVDQEELEGVFVIREHRAFFQPVATGISGLTEVEILTGLQEGDEIVTGSYEALRTLQPGERVRVENGRTRGGFGN
ncbi:MAG: efflux RND transporter periplasmic adaptor subunit [Acidobacteria bacterium]|nr:efflux RND transporter periplasmic adaptor subunit [Acidobacteriota bacterium]